MLNDLGGKTKKTIYNHAGHLLWIGVSISILIAIYDAYVDAYSGKCSLDLFLPKIANFTTNTNNGTSPS
jgi:hypothetical protein